MQKHFDETKAIEELETLTFWRHRKTGELFVLQRIAREQSAATLQRLDGRTFSIPIESLRSLYFEIDDDTARDLIRTKSIDEILSKAKIECASLRISNGEISAGDLYSRSGDLPIVTLFKPLGGQRKNNR